MKRERTILMDTWGILHNGELKAAIDMISSDTRPDEKIA